MKRFIVIVLLIVICPTLSTATTSDTEETIHPIAIELLKGQKAPYQGVLIPEWDYRMMTSDIEMKYAYQEELLNLKADHDSLKEKNNGDRTIWLLVGIAIGAFASQAISK